MNPLIQDTFIAPACLDEIGVVYEDEHVLVINKPSGLLSLSGKNPANKDSVHWRLVQHWPSAILVHRLDFGTSGLLVVALSKAVAAQLNKQFQTRSIRKQYDAILSGVVARRRGVIDASIAKDAEQFPKVKICAQFGKPAQTEFNVLAVNEQKQHTHIGFYPITGRTHQLRVHSAVLGHPILGCDLYGSEVSKNAASRLMLHANELTFKHPVTGVMMNPHCDSGFSDF